jgi:photosystem II stability/assembly factor-like uncharacterized protein
MPKPNADEVVSSRHVRTYIQFGQARPNNIAQYAGQDSSYIAVEGLTVSELGSIEPRYVHDPRKAGNYRLISRTLSPADLPTATIKLMERHGGIPSQLKKKGCGFNLYMNTGSCVDLSDFTGGWSDYVLVLAGALVTSKDLGNRNPWDTDTVMEDSLSVTLTDVFPIGALSFGEVAGAQVDREVIDLVYGGSESCGDCGQTDDGTQRIYAIATTSGAGSPGLPAEVVYSLDGGATWLEKSIDGIAASSDVSAIEIVGNRLVVTSVAETGYFWADLSSRGVPGTFTKVSVGRALNDVVALSAREVYFAANGGYVYGSTDVTAGVTALTSGTVTGNNLLRIAAQDDVIVAVGASSTVIKSVNRGASFSTTTGAAFATSTSIQAVAVLDKTRYWVGGANGRVVYTLDGGETWTQQGFSGNGAGQVRDIVFASDEVGFFLHDTAAPLGRVFSTWNGGKDWAYGAPRIQNLPTANRFNRIAVPNAHISVAANRVALAGLASGGTDGIVAIGASSER